MSTIKLILKWLGFFLVSSVLIGLAQIGWGMYREPIAKKEAQNFCASIKVGQSTDGLREKAIDSGAKESFAKWTAKADNNREMMVTFVGMQPFSRHTCLISANDSIVIHSEYIHMD